MSVTKLSTGDIDQLNGAHALFNFQELTTDGALTHSGAKAYNQLVRAVFPLIDSWKLTVLGTWNQTKVYTNDNTGATLLQTQLFGKNFGLTDDPHQWEPDQGQVIDLTDRSIRRDIAPPRRSDEVTQVRPSWILGAQVPDRGYHLGTS